MLAIEASISLWKKPFVIEPHEKLKKAVQYFKKDTLTYFLFCQHDDVTLLFLVSLIK